MRLTTSQAASASSSINSGTTTVDFGIFPGKSDASVVITGQTNIVAGSIVQAWIRPVATVDHTADEHMFETLKVYASDIVPGSGFTIYAINTNTINEPVETVPHEVSVFTASATTIGIKNAQPKSIGTVGACGPTIYGLFTVAWTWI